MEHGTTTYLEVLTARQSLLSAQLTRTANRFTEIQSVINLYRALGAEENSPLFLFFVQQRRGCLESDFRAARFMPFSDKIIQ